MDNTHKMVRLSTTIPEYVKERLEEIRKLRGYPSTSRAIESLVMEDSISRRIDALISVIEGKQTHGEHIQDKKPQVLVGLCAKYCSKEKQNVVATRYTDKDDNIMEELLCKKHLMELIQYQKNNGGKLEYV
jgi:metal-responsive CopG/Arc/MetJ family transcriptional regulator